MERKFTLSCCSTVDLPYSYMESRDIPVLFYTYVVDGQTYDDDMGRDPAALPRFYQLLDQGEKQQCYCVVRNELIAQVEDITECLGYKRDFYH